MNTAIAPNPLARLKASRRLAGSAAVVSMVRVRVPCHLASAKDGRHEVRVGADAAGVVRHLSCECGEAGDAARRLGANTCFEVLDVLRRALRGEATTTRSAAVCSTYDELRFPQWLSDSPAARVLEAPVTLACARYAYSVRAVRAGTTDEVIADQVREEAASDWQSHLLSKAVVRILGFDSKFIRRWANGPARICSSWKDGYIKFDGHPLVLRGALGIWYVDRRQQNVHGARRFGGGAGGSTCFVCGDTFKGSGLSNHLNGRPHEEKLIERLQLFVDWLNRCAINSVQALQLHSEAA